LKKYSTAPKFIFCPICKNRLLRKQIDRYKRLTCQKCGWIYYKNPLPVAVCVVKNKKGLVLIAKRNLKPGINKWALPGGFIEANEAPEKACLRELEEETGLKGVVKRLLGVYSHKTLQYGSLLIVGYEVSVFSNRVVLSNELKEAKFFNKKNVPFIPFLSHRKMLKEVFRQDKIIER
jgi:ADP-ribose pyrophosphatase YjhB (NUDIX family)